MHLCEICLGEVKFHLDLLDLPRLHLKGTDGRQDVLNTCEDVLHLLGSNFGLVEINSIELSS